MTNTEKEEIKMKSKSKIKKVVEGQNGIPSFEDRAKMLLDFAYRGIYHCPKIHKIQSRFPWWELNEYQSLSTYDFDLLTRLVVGAHDMCLRVEVCSSGPGMVKIRIHNRERSGMMHERHPTMEEALEKMDGRVGAELYASAG